MTQKQNPVTRKIRRSAGALSPGRDIPVAGSQFSREQFRPVDGMDDFFISPAVSDQELAELRDRMALFEGKGKDKPIARYKLEVQFGVDHHVRGTTYGVVTIWENGSHFNGGADALIYTCPGKHLRVNNCEALIQENSESIVQTRQGSRRVPTKVTICHTCFMAWKPDQLIGQTFYRLPIEKWAEVLYRWYQRLRLDADIRVKYHYDDIRVVSEQEQERELRGEKLNRARSAARRPPKVYPLEYIASDLSAGADLQKRILAFLRD